METETNREIKKEIRSKESKIYNIKLNPGRSFFIEDQKHGDKPDLYPVVVKLGHQVEISLRFRPAKGIKMGDGYIKDIKGGSFESDGTFVTVGRYVRVFFKDRQPQLSGFPKITRAKK